MGERERQYDAAKMVLPVFLIDPTGPLYDGKDNKTSNGKKGKQNG